VNYSLQHLRKDQRREFHLSDPQQLKTDRPGRIEGSAQGMSSMQKFEGESMMGGRTPEAMREYRQQQVRYLMAQMADKKLKADAEKETDRRHDEALSNANELRCSCEAAEMQERKAEMLETRRINEGIASARSARRSAAQAKEASATQEHMVNEVERNLMRERHDYTIGLNGKKRDYKRCSYEEEVASWDVNRALVQAKLNRKQSETNADVGFCKIGSAVCILEAASDEAFEVQSIRRRQEFDAANRVLAQEQKERGAKEKSEYTSFASPR